MVGLMASPDSFRLPCYYMHMPPHSVECAYLNRTSWDAFSQGIGYMPFVSFICLFVLCGWLCTGMSGKFMHFCICQC